MFLVLDSSTLIAFCKELDDTSLITKVESLCSEICIPDSVFKEMTNTETLRKLEPYMHHHIKVVSHIDQSEITRMNNRHPALHEGEISVILYGIYFKETNQEYLCVLDDGPARKTAQKYDIKFTGTIGLIRHLGEQGIITPEDSEELIRKLKDSTFSLK